MQEGGGGGCPGIVSPGKIRGEVSPPLGIPKLQHLHYTADTAKFRQAKIAPPSLKTNFSHEIIPHEVSPNRCPWGIAF